MRPSCLLFGALLLPWLNAAADPMRPLKPAQAGDRPGSIAPGLPLAPPGLHVPQTPRADTALNPAALTPSVSPAAAPTTSPIASPAIPERPVAAGPKLLGVRQDSQGAWHALIDEQWVRAGARIGALRITAIDAAGVRLQQGKDIQRLEWLPALKASQLEAGTPARSGKPSSSPSNIRPGLHSSTHASTTPATGLAHPISTTPRSRTAPTP
jgi:hypothetical protein